MELHLQIKTARIAKKINQINLAIQMETTRNTVSNWETGTSSPNIDTLKRLSKVLDYEFKIKANETT